MGKNRRFWKLTKSWLDELVKVGGTCLDLSNLVVLNVCKRMVFLIHTQNNLQTIGPKYFILRLETGICMGSHGSPYGYGMLALLNRDKRA